MKYANVNGIKTHAKHVASGTIARDLWFTSYEVVAYVGLYRQYWKYLSDKPQLPPGYEDETEWHASWKKALRDDACEVICGENNEHRADIRTNRYVIEIQKSSIDGRDVLERNAFYKRLMEKRLIWIVNVVKPWRDKRIVTTLSPDHKDGTFVIKWSYAWKWTLEISDTTDTLLYLDFNPHGNKLIYMWTHDKKLYGKWVPKMKFFNSFLREVALEEYLEGERFLSVFDDVE